MAKEEEEDIISLLPDCLLLEIISRLELSTKQVIKATSTISKLWQHLWTKLASLSFIYRVDIPNLRYYYDDEIDISNYFSFIDKTLTQCPTDLTLNKFELIIIDSSLVTQPKSRFYSWIPHAITRNVQEVELSIGTLDKKFSYDHELFFNNSCLMSMKVSYCAFNPPNGAISWDKLKCLCIYGGELDEDSIGKILSGSPCLETLELKYCDGCLSKSLCGKFSVERLRCRMQTYTRFANGDEGFWDSLCSVSMKLSRCVLNPPNGWGNLNFLCIDLAKLDEDSIRKILYGSPCLETFKLYSCHGARRIDVASNSVKNLVFSSYGYGGPYTLEINAPYVLSLTIKGYLDLEKILLLNISSLVKAESDYEVVEKNGRTLEDIEDGLLKGLLTNLGHVNKITLRNDCLKVICFYIQVYRSLRGVNAICNIH